MNNFIMSPLDKNKFIVNLGGNIELLGKTINFDGQIDCGCGFSCFPYKYFALDNSDRTDKSYLEFKRQDYYRYKSGLIRAMRSIGVEADHNKERKPIEEMTEDEILKDSSISFVHTITGFTMAGYYLGTVNVKINYDRDHLPLIGMNILRRLQYHGGKSSIIHSDVFIACLKRNLTPEYFDALEQHLGLVPKEKALVEKDKYIEEYKESLVDEAMEKALKIARKEVATASTSGKNEKHKDIAASFRDFYGNIFPNVKDNK